MIKIVEDVDDLQKLAVLQAQMIDNTTKRLHPKEATQLESIARRIKNRKNGMLEKHNIK